MRLLVEMLIVALLAAFLAFAGCAGHVSQQENLTEIVYPDFDEVWDIITRNHLYEVDNTPAYKLKCSKQILTGALSECLHDPYARYFSKQEMQEMEVNVNGSLIGVGIQFLKMNDQTMILGVYKGGPADLSGRFQRGDVIVEINGTDIQGGKLSQVADLIGNEEWVPIRIVTSREGIRQEPILLVTKKVDIQSVGAVDLDSETIYIRISEFTESTPRQFLEAIAERIATELPDRVTAFSQASHDVIVDVRKNPGGVLTAAGLMSFLFAHDASDIFVTIQTRFNEVPMRMSYYQESGIPLIPGLLGGLRVVVLIDKETGSAAEIFALFLREAVGATLIGKQTFGKGSIQMLYSSKSGDGFAMTTAHYLVGNDKVPVDKIGVTPDIEVNMSGAPVAFGDDLPNDFPEHIDVSADPQLKKAFEILKFERKVTYAVRRK